jgi:hypothetical protein
MATPKTAGFERDFGYLFPFLDKLVAAARAMPAGPGRTRLEQLLGEERGRWEEMRGLLAGKAPARSAAAVKSAPRAPPLVTSANANAARTRPPASTLTVGSLRPRE